MSEYHIPRPPQLEFLDIAHTQVGISDAYNQANFGVANTFLDRHLYGNDEQRPLEDPYQNGSYGSQSSTSYSIDGTQGYRPWRTPSPQTGGQFDSFEGTFQKQGLHIEAPSATNPRNHMVPPRASTALYPQIVINEAGRARRKSQNMDCRPSGIQMSNSDCQIDPMETITTGYRNPSLFSLDRLSGDARRLAATQANNNPDVSDHRHNGQSPYQGSSGHPPAYPSLDQTQGILRGRKGSLSFGQNQSTMRYIMEPLPDHGLTRNVHVAPQGYRQTAQEDSPNLQYGEASKPLDNKIRKSQRITAQGSKKECRSNFSSPTTRPTTNKRVRRKYGPAERVEVGLKRKTGACEPCRKAKRKASESRQMNLHRCRQADYSCSASIRDVRMALP